MLTDLQRVMLAQLRRRNCQVVAEQAESCWGKGQRSYIDARVRCPQWLRHLFFEANDQTIEALPKVAEPSVSELFAWRPRQRRAAKAYEWKIVAGRECPSPDKLLHCDAPAQAIDYWRRHVATAPYFSAECECLAALLLTIKKRIRGHHLISIGTLNEAMAHPREAFRAAVIGGAHAIVLMHNHPSGKADPSSADVQTTRVLAEAGRILKIEVIDHIIIGHDRH
jgi:hypothetical protein